MEISITNALLDEVVAHARAALPDEACGLLFGRGGRVELVRPVKNSEPSPVSYVFDPDDQMAAMKEMGASGLELLGIYHSHPESPPVPSLTDIRRAFFPGTHELNYPGVVYMIVGLSEPATVVKAYVIGEAGAEKVSIRMIH